MKNSLLLVSIFFLVCTYTHLPVLAYGFDAITRSVDSSSLELVATITLEKNPLGIAVNEETGIVYVGVEGCLMVIDGETNEIVAEIPLQFARGSRS